ncbi:hypothetical protein Y11_21551 [Yersinia enterocolitica subsp. palearctica Y11]|uniref:Uncharacterized protein n=1 Tax=Yersinia enterocolitica subsp. palearctica serotype O:3 (strain DSM 13030 / CIP 106945 / Y11) TaxID=930944 RepID=A0A0H3NLK9_YERE1|nr:hypothetical protein Y11_21551 [Yersinia enterocolitica subsp. palearctica Y11]CCO69757.1 hypothetical protein D322_2883 [Yersinia enterocolitica IP 10393]
MIVSVSVERPIEGDEIKGESLTSAFCGASNDSGVVCRISLLIAPAFGTFII